MEILSPSGKKPSKIAVIGQGFLGANLSTMLEGRNIDVIRIDKDSPKSLYKRGSTFFVCVPTPTVGFVFDEFVIRDVCSHIPNGSLVIVRSTVEPHVARDIISDHPKLRFAFVPEFLDADRALEDTLHPSRIVVGIDRKVDGNDGLVSSWIHCLLAPSKGETPLFVMSPEEACLVKYAANGFFTVKNVFFNVMYDLATQMGCDYQNVMPAVASDRRIGAVHAIVPHKGGRGATGPCLPKDSATLFGTVVRVLGKDSFQAEFMAYVLGLNRINAAKSNKDMKNVKSVYDKPEPEPRDD